MVAPVKHQTRRSPNVFQVPNVLTLQKTDIRCWRLYDQKLL